jgi:hypothetical protein
MVAGSKVITTPGLVLYSYQIHSCQPTLPLSNANQNQSSLSLGTHPAASIKSHSSNELPQHQSASSLTLLGTHTLVVFFIGTKPSALLSPINAIVALVHSYCIIMLVDLHGAYEFMPLCPPIVAAKSYCIIRLAQSHRLLHQRLFVALVQSYCWCFVRFVQFNQFPPLRLHLFRLSFVLLVSTLSSRSSLCVSFTLYNLPWPYGISCSIFSLTKQSSSIQIHSCGFVVSQLQS